MKKSKLKVTSKEEFRHIRIETRGRKPLSRNEIVQKMKDELSKLIMKIEKEMVKELPESNGQVKEHLKNTIRRVVN